MTVDENYRSSQYLMERPHIDDTRGDESWSTCTRARNNATQQEWAVCRERPATNYFNNTMVPGIPELFHLFNYYMYSSARRRHYARHTS